MSKYLDRLIAINLGKTSQVGTAKTVKSPFGSFDSSEGDPFSENRFAADREPDRANEARLDWWVRPVAGWRDGKLTLHNFASGVVTEIDLKTGAMRRRYI